MNTKEWGPSMWITLHSITFGYPENPTEQHKKNYKNYFESLTHVLPCSYCRESYAKIIKCIKIDDYLNSRQCLTFWLYNVHNCVNEKLKVNPKNIPSYESVVKKYEEMRACSKNKK